MLIKNRAAAAIASVATLAGAAAVTVAVSGPAAHADEHNRIIGGQEANNPWAVQLVFKQDDGKKYGCSGEAISAEWVLTAKHCIKGTTSMDVFFSNDITNRGPATAVDKMEPSPKGDVALVHLSQAHQLQEYGPITSGYDAQSGQKGEIQGYGLRANKEKAKHLNKASVNVLGESMDAFLGSAVHIKGVDGASNHGDSGGPLIIDGKIVAVCSTGDTADPGDNINATSNYANITASLPWIEKTSGVKPGGGPAPTPSPTGSTAPAPTPSPSSL